MDARVEECMFGFRVEGLTVSLGDAGLRIKWSMIWISSHPNSIFDYDPILIPMTILCRQLQFLYKFDLFLMFSSKID